MKRLNFTEDQCVLIENSEQYNSICHMTRSGREREITEQFYMEHDGKGCIGMIHQPIGTWSGKRLEVISFKKATE